MKVKDIKSSLTLLHIFLFENPFAFSHMHSNHIYDCGSIIPIMRSINEKIEELL